MLSNKYKLTALIGVCWLSLQGNVALASENTQATPNDNQIRRLSQRTQALESELQRVQNKIASLRRQYNPKSNPNPKLSPGEVERIKVCLLPCTLFSL